MRPSPSEIGRFKLTDQPDGLKIVIPSDPPIARLMAYTLGLAIALTICIPLVRPMIGEGSWSLVSTQLTFGLVLGIGFLLTYLVLLLRSLAGCETITVTMTDMKVRKSILGIGFTRSYPRAAVKNLRCREPRGYDWMTESRFLPPIVFYRVAFDFNGRLGYIGMDLRRHEAHRLIQILKDRCQIA